MAEFCYAFPGLSPSGYWELNDQEYRALRRKLERLSEANKPKSKQEVPFQQLAAMYGDG